MPVVGRVVDMQDSHVLPSDVHAISGQRGVHACRHVLLSQLHARSAHRDGYACNPVLLLELHASSKQTV